jgi:hypothetical protein
MEQSGVGSQNDAVNAMWQNEQGRMAKARNQARMARNRGEYASAHSIMLSAYITALGGKPVEGRRPMKFFLLALYHALCMWYCLEKLNHNQLDVWLSFMLKLRAKMPVFKSVLNETLLRAAVKEINGAKLYGKPHQLALADLTYAEVVLVTGFMPGETYSIVYGKIYDAFLLEQLIREEPGQPHGLRQFVRILRKAAEISMSDEMCRFNPNSKHQAQVYLRRALELAFGEADAPDQIPKIQALIEY